MGRGPPVETHLFLVHKNAGRGWKGMHFKRRTTTIEKNQFHFRLGNPVHEVKNG